MDEPSAALGDCISGLYFTGERGRQQSPCWRCLKGAVQPGFQSVSSSKKDEYRVEQQSQDFRVSTAEGILYYPVYSNGESQQGGSANEENRRTYEKAEKSVVQ